jgi:hypothetical protein
LLFLPRKGYKTITVTEKVHADIKTRANETNRTLKEYIEYLFANDTVAKDPNIAQTEENSDSPPTAPSLR